MEPSVLLLVYKKPQNFILFEAKTLHVEIHIFYYMYLYVVLEFVWK